MLIAAGAVIGTAHKRLRPNGQAMAGKRRVYLNRYAAVETHPITKGQMFGRFSLRCGLAAAAAMLAAAPACAAPTVPNKNASSTVTIGTAASFRKLQDMDFGALAVNGAGTATIDPNTDTMTVTGGIVQIGGRAYAAAFETVAPRRSRVLIKAPNQPITLTRVGGTETMTLSNFTVSGSTSRNVNSGDPIAFKVGGKLTVNAGQVEGTYVGTFDVVVNYN
jgi:hypothetical protein